MTDFREEQEQKGHALKTLQKLKAYEKGLTKSYTKVIRGAIVTTKSKERLGEYEEILNKRTLLKE